MAQTWRQRARTTLAEVFKYLPEDADEKTVREAVKGAYPFGERSMHPYKVWLDETNKWIDKRFPESARAKNRERLQREIQKREQPQNDHPTLF